LHGSAQRVGIDRLPGSGGAWAVEEDEWDGLIADALLVPVRRPYDLVRVGVVEGGGQAVVSEKRFDLASQVRLIGQLERREQA
jgi:hypothetical protein